MEVFLNALLAYFVIIDPVGVTLIFDVLTQNKDAERSRKIAIHVIVISFMMIIGFGFFGNAILSRLGIAIESFRIAGGLLLFYAAFRMVKDPGQPEEVTTNQQAEDVTVFPLSFPLLAGPGCLTLTILMFAKVRPVAGGLASVISAISVILLVTLILFLISRRIVNTIGEKVNSVMKRLLGVLLASLSIQFIVDGIKGLI